MSCPGSQNDITISGDLLYLSTDSSRSDTSCASTTSPTTLKESWEGIKIFDVSNPRVPKYIKAVETKCGSHTNTLVPGKKSDFIYVSSYSPRADYPDCQPPHDSISIVEVPKKNPTAAKVVAEPNLFPDGGNPGGVHPSGDTYSATTGCHDITAYPSKNIAAGACMGDGVIMDISNPAAPKVIERVQDTDELRVLALGDVQQRRHQGRLHRRARWRRSRHLQHHGRPDPWRQRHLRPVGTTTS